jgi:hypothetical protein
MIAGFDLECLAAAAHNSTLLQKWISAECGLARPQLPL